MKKWIITWNCGYGDTHEEVECETFDEALKMAYEEWREEAESQADYSAQEWNDETAYDLGLIDEDPSEEE